MADVAEVERVFRRYFMTGPVLEDWCACMKKTKNRASMAMPPHAAMRWSFRSMSGV